jgi:beta-lactamase superfamily II metal-dependent hydrolase
LDVLIKTHLHSDHCGGNSHLQNNYVDLQILEPSMQFTQLSSWEKDALMESWREVDHEAELRACGEVTADYRRA